VTYWKFHALFNLPLLLAAAALGGPHFFQKECLVAGGIVLAAVLVFTTPWDNHAVAKGIWGFPRERYTLKIWHLPVEEYAFFLIESIQVMLLVSALVRLFPDVASFEMAFYWAGPAGLFLFAGFFFPWTRLGLKYGKWISGTRGHYAWHLLYWFIPVIFVQWIIGGHILLPRLGLIVLAAGIIGTWLSFADWVAVRKGIWFFDEKQITGRKFFGVLPWEEVAFFYLTAWLVAQSYLLFLPEALR
jgi:lycopene cyclase domain-containing protein